MMIVRSESQSCYVISYFFCFCLNLSGKRDVKIMQMRCINVPSVKHNARDIKYGYTESKRYACWPMYKYAISHTHRHNVIGVIHGITQFTWGWYNVIRRYLNAFSIFAISFLTQLSEGILCHDEEERECDEQCRQNTQTHTYTRRMDFCFGLIILTCFVFY